MSETEPKPWPDIECWIHLHRDRHGYEAVEVEIVNGRCDGMMLDAPPGTPLSPCNEGSADQWCKGWIPMRQVKT